MAREIETGGVMRSVFWIPGSTPEGLGATKSEMIGTVYVLSEADYTVWLGQGSGEGSMAEQGQALFNQLGCGNCHASMVNNGIGRGPNLNGLFGSRVDLKDGSAVKADESYIRESVMYPQSKIVAGFDDVMPTFKGLISDDGMLKLIEYVKSLGMKNGARNTMPPGSTMTSATAPQAGRGVAPKPATPAQPAAAGKQ